MNKFCKDCRHVVDRSGSATWWQCALTETVNLTDGKQNFDMCSITRATPTKCGTEGLWFESIRPEAESDKFRYADEKEPDRYRSEDERLDDPRHGQCVSGVFKT